MHYRKRVLDGEQEDHYISGYCTNGVLTDAEKEKREFSVRVNGKTISITKDDYTNSIFFIKKIPYEKITSLRNFYINGTYTIDIHRLDGLDNQNVDLSYLSYNNKDLGVDFQRIDNDDGMPLNPSNKPSATNLSYAYYGCSEMVHVPYLFGSFETSACTNMSYMFCNCSKLDFNLLVSSQNANDIDMTSVVSATSMFENCSTTVQIGFLEYEDCPSLQYVNRMFYGCSNLTDLTIANDAPSPFGENLKTCRQMFRGCTNLESVSWFVISSACTDLSEMFYGCEKIDIDSTNLSKWDTSNVTDMNAMFAVCKQIGTLYQTFSWNVEKVKRFDYMFQFVNSGLDVVGGFYIDLTNWHINSAQRIDGMFSYAKIDYIDMFTSIPSTLTNISFLFAHDSTIFQITGFEDWNTSNVANMDQLFSNCPSLGNVNVSKWNTSKATSFGNMFLNCGAMDSIDLTNWTCENVETWNNMFSGCTNLTEIICPNFKDFTKAKTWNTMFSSCPNLDKIVCSCEFKQWAIENSDPTKFDQVYLANGLPDKFKDPCYSGWVTSEDCADCSLKHFSGKAKMIFANSFEVIFNQKTDAPLKVKVTDEIFDETYDYELTSLFNAFVNQKNIQELTITKLDTSNVVEVGAMFQNCSGLTSLDLSNIDTSNIVNMTSMFDNCYNLNSLDVSTWNTSNVTNMNSVFQHCSGLTSLDLSSWDTSNVTNMGSMFFYCKNLISLDLSNFTISKLTIEPSLMFVGCDSLSTIKCNLAFRNWCIENIFSIGLPVVFQDTDYEGWIIV